MQTHNRNGAPSVYGFACGYVQRLEYDSDNRVSLEREHGCYHIKGFDNGKHFWVSHRFIGDARATFRETAQRLRLNVVYKRAERYAERVKANPGNWGVS